MMAALLDQKPTTALRDTVDIGRLCAAIQRSRRALQPFRELRLHAIKQFKGNHWGEQTQGEKRRPLNLISLFVKIVSRSLIAKDPRWLLSTLDESEKPAVSAMQSWLNEETQRQYLAETLRGWVIDALFSIGILEVALGDDGEPFVLRIDLDDFVFDSHATKFTGADFIGHRFRMRLDEAREVYGRNRELEASNEPMYNSDGDERIKMLGRGTAMDDDEYRDHVDLWQIYLPKEQLLVVLKDDAGLPNPGARPLRVSKWIGPKCGPYHILGLGPPVPDNAMPKGPVMDLIDLDEAVNKAYRKMVDDADRMKEILLTMSTETAEKIKNASNGDIINTTNVEDSKAVMFGGPSPVLQAWAMQMQNVVSWLAGNLDLMGGLAPQSKTLGQDKMLNENASAGIADMQDTVERSVARMGRALAWFFWEHPEKVMTTQYQHPDVPELSFTRKLHPLGAARMNEFGFPEPEPLQRALPFEKLNLRLDPYSLQHKSPQQRAMMLMEMLQTVILPMMPILQQQGIGIDMNAVLTKLGEYRDMVELPEILSVTEPPQQDAETGLSHDRTMPVSTNREYTRHNVSEATKTGMDGMLQQALLGQNAGGAQRTASPSRNGGY